MAKKKKTIVRYDDKYYDEILNKNRIIYLYDCIDDGSAEKLNKKLVAMYLRNKKKPISIYINSPGGSCIDGFSIIDTIEQLKKEGAKIYTIITGYACSMGSQISVTGSKRFMSKRAYYMLHPMTTGGNRDYYPFLQDREKFTKHLNAQLLQTYRENTNIPEKILKKFERGEVWLNADECLKYGVVDKIL